MDPHEKFVVGAAEIMERLGEDVRKMQKDTVVRLDREPEVVLWLAQHGFASLAEVPPERIGEIVSDVLAARPPRTH